MPNTHGTTGRYLVLLEDAAAADATRELSRVAGVSAASTAETPATGAADELAAADGVVLHELGVAVVSADDDQADALHRATTEQGPLARVEPERFVRAYSDPATPAIEAASSEVTWGLEATGAHTSTATGEWIRVAILDTGVDLSHPDLQGRAVIAQSFVDGESANDGNGHGTHCIGTACGPRTSSGGPGYGVAPNAEVYAGKVLSDDGYGGDGGILAGIQWAISHRCPVVSMSLGAPTRAGDPHSQVYETIAKRAMRRGTLIVAAAGNESRRDDGHIAPVSHPANCPSILSVGAVDVALRVADFSCGTVDPNGAVDMVGPGVDVHSAWPMPDQYQRISGTSMATPHVAGVAALLAQQYGARSWELWARLTQTARRLPLPSTDIGAGLVQAP